MSHDAKRHPEILQMELSNSPKSESTLLVAFQDTISESNNRNLDKGHSICQIYKEHEQVGGIQDEALGTQPRI